MSNSEYILDKNEYTTYQPGYINPYLLYPFSPSKIIVNKLAEIENASKTCQELSDMLKNIIKIEQESTHYIKKNVIGNSFTFNTDCETLVAQLDEINRGNKLITIDRSKHYVNKFNISKLNNKYKYKFFYSN